MIGAHHLESGAAAVVLASTFLWGRHVHPLRSLVHDRRTIISFGAGVSAAYVFVHVLPELHDARLAFARAAAAPLRYEGIGIYFLCLVGFLVFYGLDHLRASLKRAARAARPVAVDGAFVAHVGGFAAYVWMMAYALVESFDGSVTSIALYTFAIAVHFLGIDHALTEEHGADYERIGRFVLAGMALLGWGMGQLVQLPPGGLALLLAFISGGIIVNSALMELPSDKDGRFLPFLSGGLIYGLILLPLGSG